MADNCDNELDCCNQSPQEGDCCQPQPFSYQSSVYSNTEQCATATCPEGQVGDLVRVCIAAGSYTSSVSQAAADALALAAAEAQAAVELVCTCSDLEAPTITPSDGSEVIFPVEVSIYHSNPNVKIYYRIFIEEVLPYVLYTGPFQIGNQNATVFAYAVLDGCPGSEIVQASYTAAVACAPYEVDEAVTYAETCGINQSEVFQSGPYSAENLLAVYNLYELYPYVQMWDGECPLGCRDNPRQHTNGSLIIGPFDVNVEIFAITALFFDDDYSFDSDELSGGNCGRFQRPVCAETILKTLTAGTTTEFKVWETHGANCYALGYIGVREAGETTDCTVDPPPEECACNSSGGTIESVMRALQERWRLGNGFTLAGGDGTYIALPARILPTPSATPNYPVNGWYGSESGAQRLVLVKWIAEHFDDFIATNYVSTNTLEGLEVGDVPLWTAELLGVPDPTDIDSVSSGLTVLRGCVCNLKNIFVQGVELSTGFVRETNPAVENNNEGTIKQETEAVFNAEVPLGSVTNWGNVSAYLQRIPDTTACIGAIQSGYGQLEHDLTNYGQGAAVCFTRQEFAAEEQTLAPGYLQFASHLFTDEKFHTVETSTSGSNYLSPTFGVDGDFTIEYPLYVGSSFPPVIGYGWRIIDFVLLVQKSNVPATGDWSYYP